MGGRVSVLEGNTLTNAMLGPGSKNIASQTYEVIT